MDVPTPGLLQASPRKSRWHLTERPGPLKVKKKTFFFFNFPNSICRQRFLACQRSHSGQARLCFSPEIPPAGVQLLFLSLYTPNQLSLGIQIARFQNLHSTQSSESSLSDT